MKSGSQVVMTLTIVAVIFAVFAIPLIVLLIYNSTLSMHRDDQLFLHDAELDMHEEQTQLLAKVNRLLSDARAQHWFWYIPPAFRGDCGFYEKLNARE